MGDWMLTDLKIDRDGLREMLHPALRSAVDEIESCGDLEAVSWTPRSNFHGVQTAVTIVALRVRDSAGQIVGTVAMEKPQVGMTMIGMFTAFGDVGHLQRMNGLSTPSRRPAAVLFADLEGSAKLSKRMPTPAFFKLVRRLTRAADKCVIDEGGLVGRHAGDGFAAFFVAGDAESESTAARACISAARALQEAMSTIAERHELPVEDVVVRAGLHWGSKLYIGSIVTPGRTEVTALGDEVNEAARIEACATGGRLLASKDLIERLDGPDAARLGIDAARITYKQLGDLDTATEKARRDAPTIPVYDIATCAP
jgi:class 3 adenylate cyclase